MTFPWAPFSLECGIITINIFEVAYKCTFDLFFDLSYVGEIFFEFPKLKCLWKIKYVFGLFFFKFLNFLALSPASSILLGKW